MVHGSSPLRMDSSGGATTVRGPAMTQRSAFTLIELLVVILVIGILSGLMLPALGLVREGAKKSDARAMVRELVIACESYRNEDVRRRYPPTADDAQVDPATMTLQTGTGKVLTLLLDRGLLQLRKNTLVDGVLNDPWGGQYRYLVKRPTPAVGAATDWNWDLNRTTPREKAWDELLNAAAPFPYIFAYGKNKTAAPVAQWIYADDAGIN